MSADTEGTQHPAVVLLAAGGTGGHLFPAQALAEALARRRFVVDLATDRRAERYGSRFPARSIHLIASETLRGRDPVSIARSVAKQGVGVVQALHLVSRIKPAAVVGFGGYPTIPPVLAAVWRRIPTLIHEQNAVMGRANRLLASRVDALALSFPGVLDGTPKLKPKAAQTGNPVRALVIAAAERPYVAPDQPGPFHLLIFGGSQGAHVMAQIVPSAIALLDRHLQSRIRVVQQAREEDLARVQDAYARTAVVAEIATFFPDLPARIAGAHLVLARAGASTIAELTAIGRPAILVPLPHALDQDQSANAGVLANAGGAIRVLQRDFAAPRLAAEITMLASAPQKLVAMAAAARAHGVLDAAERLADLVEGLMAKVNR